MRVTNGGEHFRGPYWDRGLRELTARDRRVIRAVLGTPGIRQLLAATITQAHAYTRSPGAGQHTLSIAVGCAGGRHPAGVTAYVLARRLRRRGHQVALVHRDLHMPAPAALPRPHRTLHSAAPPRPVPVPIN
ncbi:RNase adapter RapZ [Streptomyces sp. RPA4-2]|uniref:RapZ C-terminal domain-containing protein n=1 Tax=Streptomyces sp. RPA4-2 TaxID=2721244 RepID=UPI00143ED21A|nr:RNase adapter RapZ [Streptomyces sp. RPA4-2]QIY66467.1 ATPase [Streptomyces sp. RPA4-2]